MSSVQVNVFDIDRNGLEESNVEEGPIIKNKHLIYSSFHSDPSMKEIINQYVNSLSGKMENLYEAFSRNDVEKLQYIVPMGCMVLEEVLVLTF